MFNRLLIHSLILSFIFATSVLATSITFTFANGQITGTSPKFYEFDVMAHAGAIGTRIGDNQTYINYNTNAFGTNIADSTDLRINVFKGTLIEGDLGGDPLYPLYEIANVPNNQEDRVAITVQVVNGVGVFGHLLPDSPTQLVHIKIQIANETVNSGLSFEQSLMDGQQYENSGTKYVPVIAIDTDDSPLPVELSNFTTEILEGNVVLKWVTESETNNLGFEVYRAPEEGDDYALLSSYATNPDLTGQGNSSTRHEYSYIDESIESETTYWYKLADVDFNGVKTFHEPISVTVPKGPEIPTAFQLHPNYPNPFNPITTLQFDIPRTGAEQIDTKVIIYNLLGQAIKTLIQDKLSPGSYKVQWNGTTDFGNSAPSGIYFVVFKTDKFFQTRKLTLLK